MVQFIHVAILGLFLMCSLIGCAGLTDMEPAVSTPLPPKRIAVPQKKPVKRELGSLWSPESAWNDIYSDPPLRLAGDVLEVNISKSFKTRVLRRLKKEFPIRVKTKIDIKKKKVEAKVVPTSDKLAKDDSSLMHATIIEKLPRGVYRIAGSETLRLGSRDPVVSFEGEVRDRDISEEDSLSSDAILNLAMDLKPYGRQRTLSSSDEEE